MRRDRDRAESRVFLWLGLLIQQNSFGDTVRIALGSARLGLAWLRERATAGEDVWVREYIPCAPRHAASTCERADLSGASFFLAPRASRFSSRRRAPIASSPSVSLSLCIAFALSPSLHRVRARYLCIFVSSYLRASSPTRRLSV